ncbi:MAG: site-2 protease family protein [Bacteroidetes bacterium]|nr:site-2 protease family protein [Bacteroidota bacterium]
MLPKFPATTAKRNTPASLFISLIIYLFAGYWMIPDPFFLLILISILFFHEAGHWLAMRYFNYQDTAIFFIPFLGAMVSGSKRNLSESQSALIILAGPVPGFLLGWLLFQFGNHTPLIPNHTISWAQTGWLMMMLNGANLLPIFPLDGGQLLNRVYLGEEGRVSNVYIIFSCLCLTGLALYMSYYFLLIIPIWVIWRQKRNNHYKKIERIIEERKIDNDFDYPDLPDSSYWEIREILIQVHPAFQTISKERDSYDQREPAIQYTIEHFLKRSLIQDLSFIKKMGLALGWTLLLFAIIPVILQLINQSG